MQRIVLVFMAFLLLWPLQLLAAVPTSIKVAIDAEYAPYEFLENGKIQGYLPELLRAIARDGGFKVEFVALSWPNVLVALESGDVDLINMIRHPERESNFLFSKPHSSISQALFADRWEHGHAGLQHIAKHRIALQRGDIAVQELADRHDISRVFVDSKTEGFYLLQQQQVDFFLTAEQPGLWHLKQSPFSLLAIEMSAGKLFRRDYCFVTTKGRVGLMRLLNTGLAKMRANGELDRLQHKWLNQPHSWLDRYAPLLKLIAALVLFVLLAATMWIFLLKRRVRQKTMLLRQQNDVLNKQNRQLMHAQQLAALGYCEFDLQHDRWTCSEILEHVYGIDAHYGRDMESWFQLIHADDRQQIRDCLHYELLEQHFSCDRRFRIVRVNDGQQRWVHSLAEIELDAQQKPLRIWLVIQDVTDVMLQEQQLRHSQKMEALGTLVGGVAHNFNNYLAAITGNTYLARMQSDDPDAIRYIDQIESVSFTAADLVKQLLVFVRQGLESNQSVPISPLLKETLKTAAIGVPADISLQSDMDSVDVTVFASASELQQMLFNLLSNAVDALEGIDAEIDKNKQIKVNLHVYQATEQLLAVHPTLSGRQLICLEVADNGCGMQSDVLQHIFEPFFTTKAVDKGTGMGLSMCHGLLEKIGGAIDVVSEIGKGTKVLIYLPTEKFKKKTGQSVQVLEQSSHHIDVLFVDDDVLVREAMSKVLSKMGYSVILASDGIEAVDLFEQHRDVIDIVMMDVVMPRMNGDHAVRKIRQINPVVPVLFMTGYDAENIDFKAIDMSQTRVLGKPVKINVLRKNIEDICG